MTPHTRPIEVLLIEDSNADIDLMMESFSTTARDRRMHTVSDGEAALDFLFHRGKYVDAPLPDLILLDLNLPRKDGREVLAEIKANRETKHIPVVVLTSSDSERDVRASYRLQASSFIIKPVGLAAYQRMIRMMEEYWFEAVTLPQELPPNKLPR